MIMRESERVRERESITAIVKKANIYVLCKRITSTDTPKTEEKGKKTAVGLVGLVSHRSHRSMIQMDKYLQFISLLLR